MLIKTLKKSDSEHFQSKNIKMTNIFFIESVFCPGLKKGMVLLEEKGHFCSRNYILRALLHAESLSEGALHKLWGTQPMSEM